MRRIAVISVFFAVAQLPSCTERLLVPGGLADAGSGRGGTGPSTTGGRSGNGTGGFAGRGSGGGGSDGHMDCLGSNLINLKFTISKAKVLLSVGRNSSMTTRFGDGTRMTAVQKTLLTLVAANQNAVSFGYHDFPSTNACFDGATCCANDSWVSINSNAYSAIDQKLGDCDRQPAPSGCYSRMDRPIADALKTADLIFGPDDSADRYVILVTDGAPACAAEDSARSCQEAKIRAADLSLQGIKTHVVTVGEDVEQIACLRDIALQGGAANPTSPFVYAGRDPIQLAQSLGLIVARAAANACILDLSSVPKDGSVVSLTVQGRPVALDLTGQNGWNFSPGSKERIEVRGTACADLQKAPQNDIKVKACPL